MVTSKPQTFVGRYSASLALVTIAMTGLAVFTLKGAPGRAIQEWKNSAGSVVCQIGSGGLLSGTCTTGLGGSIFGSGNVLVVGDPRYVNTSGDTMTGSLKVRGTASGTVVRADTTLASSGSLVWEGAGSGASLWVSTFDGAGLTNCDPTAGKLTWNATTKRFTCGSDAGTTYTAGQGLSLVGSSFRLLSAFSGALTGNASTATALFADGANCSAGQYPLGVDASGAAQSCTVDANTTYTAGQGLTLAGTSFKIASAFSGSLTGNASTATALAANGANCSAGNYPLGVDANGAVETCTADANTTYTAGQGLTLAGTSFKIGTSFSGTTLKILGTMSGNIIHAEKGLSSSGNLIVRGTISGSYVRTGVLSASPVTVELIPTGSGTSITTGSGRLRYVVPKTMSGFVLYDAQFTVDTAGTTNVTSMQIRNVMKGSRKFFSTPLSIDSTELSSETAATPFVISTTNRDVSGGDYLYIDFPAVSSTAPKGANLILYFRYP